MKKLMHGAAVVPLLAMGAAAQDTAQLDAQKVKMKAELETQLRFATVGSVRGSIVKGIPYAADEITETDQTLGDGTHIHRESKTSVYRDSEGRTRRETPENITINDPVAGATYIINPKTNAVRTLKMTTASVLRRDSVSRDAVGGVAGEVAAQADGKKRRVVVGGGTGGVAGEVGGGRTTFEMRVDGDGPPNIVIDGKPLDPKQVQEMIAKAKTSGQAEAGSVTLAAPAEDHVFYMAAPAIKQLTMPKGESLGKKNVEGVIAEGTRSTQTLAVGEIGNDRPIQIVNEYWYSEEIGMTVMTKRSDPRSGDETFRLTNIRRGDPPAYLFQAPAGTERKME